MTDDFVRERFGALLDIAGQFFWELDRNHRVVYANSLLKGVFGDPVGRLCYEFLGGGKQVCVGCPVKKVFDGQERAVSERRRTTKEGAAIWWQHTATPIRNERGAIVGASELMIDVTGRRQMEESLRESEALYRNLVQEVPDVVFSLDAEGRFLFVNTRIEDLLGYPVNAILETVFAELVSRPYRSIASGIMELQPNSVWDEEVGLLDAEGHEKFARIRCTASFDERGRITGFEGVIRDRTSRRKLEEDLKRSREALMKKIRIIDELYEHIVQSGKCQAIGKHTAAVAHELRQPLAIVGGFARRMARQLESGVYPDISEYRRYVEIIVSEVARLEKILNSFIDFTTRQNVHLQPIDPNDLIEYIVGITEIRASEKKVLVSANLGPEIGEVPLDPGRFQQLVLNLISNALDAAPEGSVVKIETGASIPSDKAQKTGQLNSECFFEMKVTNGGPPIPPEHLEEVFSPFYTTKEDGTGLGLPVAKKIAEDHHGSISVKSDTSGTVFTVWLPMVDLTSRISQPLAQGR